MKRRERRAPANCKLSSDEGGGVGFGGVVGLVADAEEMAVEETDDVVAHFVGVLMGVKLGADIGSLCPFPEQFFEGLLVFGFFEGEAALFEIDAAGDEVAAAQGDDIGKELADLAEFGFGIVGESGGLSGSGEAERDPLDETIDQGG